MQIPMIVADKLISASLLEAQRSRENAPRSVGGPGTTVPRTAYPPGTHSGPGSQ